MEASSMAASSFSLGLQRSLLRMSAPIFAMLCLSFAALPARAANACPWMTEATASSLLGGDAVGAYTAAAGAAPAVCTFTRSSPEATRTLRVSVEIVSASPHEHLATMEQTCGAHAETLQAIGNEAVFCSTQTPGASASELALGRVRDQVFTITLATSLKGDRELTADVLKAHLYTAAEQVAGNLF
jgi:hypothetical protein